MVVEDAARDLEQLPDGRIWQCVPNRQPLLLGRHDAPVSQNGELLRHNRLVQLQRFLQFLNGAIAADEDLEDLDADRMCQRPKKLSFEELKRARWHRSLPSYRPQRPAERLALHRARALCLQRRPVSSALLYIDINIDSRSGMRSPESNSKVRESSKKDRTWFDKGC